MTLNDQELKKLKALAKGTKGMFLIEWLTKWKDETADVRFDIHTEPALDKPVRLAVCSVLDSIIHDLQRHADESAAPDTNEYS